MSLRVDLIQPEERRSASPVGLKLIGRLALIAIVAGVCAMVVLNVLAITNLGREIHAASADWKSTQPL